MVPYKGPSNPPHEGTRRARAYKLPLQAHECGRSSDPAGFRVDSRLDSIPKVLKIRLSRNNSVEPLINADLR